MMRRPHVVLLTLALALSALGLIAPAAQAAPTYSGWSAEQYGLSGRVSPPSSGQAKTFVQVRRGSSNETSNTGDRQVRISWNLGGATKTSAIRDLDKGQITTFATAKVRCGKQIRVTVSGRGRAGGSDWSDWNSVSYTFTRNC